MMAHKQQVAKTKESHWRLFVSTSLAGSLLTLFLKYCTADETPTQFHYYACYPQPSSSYRLANPFPFPFPRQSTANHCFNGPFGYRQVTVRPLGQWINNWGVYGYSFLRVQCMIVWGRNRHVLYVYIRAPLDCVIVFVLIRFYLYIPFTSELFVNKTTTIQCFWGHLQNVILLTWVELHGLLIDQCGAEPTAFSP